MHGLLTHQGIIANGGTPPGTPPKLLMQSGYNIIQLSSGSPGQTRDVVVLGTDSDPSGYASYTELIGGTYTYQQGLSTSLAGSAMTARLRINGVNSSLVAAWPAALNTIGVDTTNSAVTVIGDTVTTRLTNATGANTRTSMLAVCLQPSTATLSRVCAITPGNHATASVSRYSGIMNSGAMSSVSSPLAKTRIDAAGTLSNFYGYLFSMARGTTSTVTLVLNGVDQFTYNVTPGAAGGIKTISASTINVVPGDVVSWRFDNGTGSGNYWWSFIGCVFTSTSAANRGLMQSKTGTLSLSSASLFMGLGGILTSSGTEAALAVYHGFDGTASKLRVSLSANSTLGTSTISYRRAGVTEAPSVSIGAGAIGTFEDLSGISTFTKDERCNYLWTRGGVSGSVSLIALQTLETCS